MQLYYYTAKIITDHVLKVVETLAPIGGFGISFQTLNEDARKEIKRTNIKYDQFLKYIQWAKERKIVSSTEMIFGFPGETVDSYIKGLEKLLLSGVDRISSYNLRLLNGIDLSTQAYRDKYQFKTMYRLPERTFGCYDGTVVIEKEEVVVGSYSFSYDDYLEVRRYGLFLELSSGSGYLSELIQLMVKFDLPGEKIVRYLANHKFNSYPTLASLMSEYLIMSKRELFETSELCTEYFQGLLYKGMQVPEVKLNLIYTGKIMLDANTRTEFFNIVKEFVRTITNEKKQVDFFIEYIDNILALQVVSFNTNEVAIIHGQTKIRVDKIDQNNYTSMDDLLTHAQMSIEFTLHQDAVDFIKKKPLCNINDEVTLQNIYMSISRFGLLRLRRIELSSG